MTVKPMHLDVRDQIQRLAGNRTRKLEDDNIDLYLNRAQQMLVESAITPVQGSGRYQIKPGKHASVFGLLVNRLPLSAAWNGEQYMSTLPPDFWYLLDDGSKVSQLCSGDSKVTSYEVLRITRVPFPFSPATQNFYSNVELLYNNSSIFNINTLLVSRQKTWSGFPSQDAHFYIKDLLIEELTRQGIKVYWENYHTYQYPFHLVFVSNIPAVPIVLRMDGQDFTGVTEELTTEIHSVINRRPVLVPNTMVSQDKDLASQATPYFQTSYISPLSQKGPGVLYIQANESFIVCNTSINYIRKPPSISLSLGTNCGLSEDVHQKLCNDTATMILSRITDPAWKDITENNTVITQ